jgi:hypothetical protein
MKFVLTKEAKKELKAINKRIDEALESDFFDDYDEVMDEMSKRELLVLDAGFYVDGAYCENKFDDLDEWCREVQEIEYNPKYLSYHPDAVKDKVNKMIEENIIIIK